VESVESVVTPVAATSKWFMPTGAAMLGLTSLHSLGLPWTGSIVLGSVALRLLLTPLLVKMQKTAAVMSNLRPVMKPLQDKIVEARASGDVEASQLAAREMQTLFAKHNVSPFSGLIGLANIPFFMGPFFALQKLAADSASGMAAESFLWIPSLASPDPFYVVPAIAAVLQVLQLEFSAEFSKSQGAVMSDNMRNVFRVLAVVSIPIVAKFPVAVSLFWITNSFILFLQLLLLRNAGIRSFLGIPKIVTPVNLNVGGRFGPAASISAEGIRSLRVATNSSSSGGTSVAKSGLKWGDAKKVVKEAERGVQ